MPEIFPNILGGGLEIWASIVCSFAWMTAMDDDDCVHASSCIYIIIIDLI